MLWTVPQIWEGATCWVIGGGPSMPRQFGVPEDVIHSVMLGKSAATAYSPYLEPLFSQHTIGINNSYLLGDWLDMMFFGDCAWYLVHKEPLLRWPKLKVTCCNRFAAKQEKDSEGIKYLAKDCNKQYGLSSNLTMVSWNYNSGAAALSLAAHLGVKRIVLLGFDMSLDTQKVSHWFGSHDIRHPRKTPPPFARHLRGFPYIAKDAVERGIEILNASPISAITEFPKVNAKDLL